MPYGDLEGLSLGARVVPLGHGHRVLVGPGLLGRVVNGFGNPIDGKGPLLSEEWRAVDAPSPDPLSRAPVSQQFSTGVRAIDSIMTMAQGQRVGAFAPAGVGKSTLAGMMVRAADVDVCVVALVGERGREVTEFVSHTLGEQSMHRSVVVAATSDSSASERAKAGFVATTIAESFRDRGMRVLLVMGLGDPAGKSTAGDRLGLRRTSHPKRLSSFGIRGSSTFNGTCRQWRNGFNYRALYRTDGGRG